MNNDGYGIIKQFKELYLKTKRDLSWKGISNPNFEKLSKTYNIKYFSIKNNKGIETSNYIRSWEMNWDQANIIKYVTRYNLKHVDKDLQCQDLRKARHYLDRLIESYEDK